MSATSVRLLQAAGEIVGGNEALAKRLGISEALLAAYIEDRRALPDPLLLRAVDIILADRQLGRPHGSDFGATRLRLAGEPYGDA